MRYLALILFIFATLQASATQIVEWNKKPIEIVLPLGKERILEFPDNVFLGIPASLSPFLRSQSAQGFLYLTALEGFPKTRIQVKLNKSGEIILLDIRSTNTSEATTESIVFKMPSEASSIAKDEITKAQKRLPPVTPIQLTRFVSRLFYGPERLAISDPRIKQAFAPKMNLDDLFIGPSYGVFELKAEAVFRASGLYLTAIKVSNKTPVPQTIMFNDINAEFAYVTPQHLQVNQMNVAGDMTMLYIITRQPLEASIYLPVVSKLTDYKGDTHE